MIIPNHWLFPLNTHFRHFMLKTNWYGMYINNLLHVQTFSILSRRSASSSMVTPVAGQPGHENSCCQQD